jgi:uncharacterized protein (TIGR00251 family)
MSSSQKTWLTLDVLHIYVQPGSRRNEIVGLFDNRLKIKIHAQPTDGQANEELIEFLCEILKTSKSKITMIRGTTSRQKDFKIALDPIFIASQIQAHLPN